jgi:hypothetical protein
LEVIVQRIVISFDGHSQRLFVWLRCEIIFLNIAFVPSMLADFGMLLLNTTHFFDITMRNTTNLPVVLAWDLQAATSEPAKMLDLYPIRVRIAPLGEDIVHMSFFVLGDE